MLPAPLPPLPSLALLPEAAVVLAPDGLVLASSPLAAELFRTVPVGCTLGDLVPDPARLWAAVEGLATGSHVPAVPLEGVRATGCRSAWTRACGCSKAEASCASSASSTRS